MGLTVKGRIINKLYPKNTSMDDNGFKMYALVPNDIENLSINDYGNIVIKGIMPELVLKDKEYEFEVEYENRNGRVSYVVEKILTNLRPQTGEEAYLYLSRISTPTRAKNILAVYPNIIEMINNNQEVDTTKIKGVGKITMDSISKKIKAQYVYYDLIVEFKDYGLTFLQMEKLMKQFKTADIIRERMYKNPYRCLCSIAGVGFKMADQKILSANNKFLKSNFRLSEAIQYILSQNETNGNTYMTIVDLYTECRELVPECIRLFQKVLEEDKRIYMNKDTGQIAKLRTYFCESNVANMLTSLNSKVFLDGSQKPKWRNDDGEIITSKTLSEEYKKIGNIELTETQQQIIPSVIDNNVVILAGYAGAGKSASCKALIEWLEDNSKSYMLLAPTGRAAGVLSDYTNRPASTIHRALGFSNGGFKYDEYSKILVDMVIVDETTMVDVFLLEALLKALPNDCKILFVCDPAQIPSVGAGNVIQDMLKSKMFATVLLDKVFRYDEGGLSYVATKTRNGEKFLLSNTEGVQNFGKNEDYVFIQENDDNLINAAVNRYMELYKDGVSVNDMVIVSCHNKGKHGTLAINNAIQSLINPPREKMDAVVGYTKNDIQVLFNVGDRVMQTRNNYNALEIDMETECTLFNGDFGTIREIRSDGSMVCEFEKNTVILDKEQIKDIVLGYAVSCHKIQGDSRSKVILVTPKSHTYMLNRNLLYVALTRAKENLYHYGNIKTVHGALRKSENLTRKTMLLDILVNANKKIS